MEIKLKMQKKICSDKLNEKFRKGSASGGLAPKIMQPHKTAANICWESHLITRYNIYASGKEARIKLSRQASFDEWQNQHH